MRITTKSQLLNRIETIRFGAIWDIFGQICLHEYIKAAVDGKADLNAISTTLPEGTITLKQFLDNLEKLGPDVAVQVKRNSNNALNRNFFREVFRVTQTFLAKEIKEANKSTREDGLVV